MIGAIEANHLIFLSVNLSHLHRQIVRFWPRIYESDDTKLLWNSFKEFMRGCHQLIIKEARVCEESLILGVNSHHEVRMTMANMWYVIDAVKYFVSIFLIEELTLGVENFQRVISIVNCQHRIECLFSFFQNAVNLLFILLLPFIFPFR